MLYCIICTVPKVHTVNFLAIIWNFRGISISCKYFTYFIILSVIIKYNFIFIKIYRQNSYTNNAIENIIIFAEINRKKFFFSSWCVKMFFSKLLFDKKLFGKQQLGNRFFGIFYTNLYISPLSISYNYGIIVRANVYAEVVWLLIVHSNSTLWYVLYALENDRQNDVTVTYYQVYTKEAIEFTKSNHSLLWHTGRI